MSSKGGGGGGGGREPSSSNSSKRKRERSRDRDRSDKDKDKDRDRDKKHRHRDSSSSSSSSRRKDERSSPPSSRNSGGHRDQSNRHRSRSRSRSPPVNKDKENKNRFDEDRNKDRDKDRDKDKDRDRDKGRSSSHRHDSRDRRDRKRSRSRDRDRDRERKRSRSREKDSKSSSSSSSSSSKNEVGKNHSSSSSSSKEDVVDRSYKKLTLKDLIMFNPSLSVPEASSRLAMYNNAILKGIEPPSLKDLATMSKPMLIIATGSVPVAPAIAAAPPSAPVLTAAPTLASTPQVFLSPPPQLPPPPVLVLPQGEGGQETRPHREVWIGNLPPGTTLHQLADFLNNCMLQLGVNDPLGCVLAAWVFNGSSGTSNYGFVEFRTIEATNAALASLNSIAVGFNGSYRLLIRRPSGYNGTNCCIQVPLQLPNQNLVGVGSITGSENPFQMDWTNFKKAIAPPEKAVSYLATLAAQAISGSASSSKANNNYSSLSNSNSSSSSSSSSTTTASVSKFIMVNHIPTSLEASKIIELVSSFGEIRAHNIVKAGGSELAAILEYADSASLELAVSTLVKFELIENVKLMVQKLPIDVAKSLLMPTNASISSQEYVPEIEEAKISEQPIHIPVAPILSQHTSDGIVDDGDGGEGNKNGNNNSNSNIDSNSISDIENSNISNSINNQILNVNSGHILQQTSGEVLTNIISLKNMSTDEDLTDDELYQYLVEDTEEECRKFGRVVSVVIPRSGLSAGLVFVEFSAILEAVEAKKALHGRAFNGRLVEVAYVAENNLCK